MNYLCWFVGPDNTSGFKSIIVFVCDEMYINVEPAEWLSGRKLTFYLHAGKTRFDTRLEQIFQ